MDMFNSGLCKAKSELNILLEGMVVLRKISK